MSNKLTNITSSKYLNFQCTLCETIFKADPSIYGYIPHDLNLYCDECCKKFNKCIRCRFRPKIRKVKGFYHMHCKMCEEHLSRKYQITLKEKGFTLPKRKNGD